MKPLRGSCLCGQVQYTVAAIGPIQFCHCRTCQRAQGAPYIAAAAVPKADFHWVAGADKIHAYASSPGKYRYFCSVCGSPLFSARTSNEHLALRVNTLWDDPGVRPVQHIWEEDACPWTHDAADLEHHAQWPQ